MWLLLDKGKVLDWGVMRVVLQGPPEWEVTEKDSGVSFQVVHLGFVQFSFIIYTVTQMFKDLFWTT